MMFRAEHGNHAIQGCGNTHGKGMRPAKAGVIRVHGAPLGEPSDEGSASGPPTANTHARKGTSGRHLDRFRAASLEPSKRCSRVPLIGLARLRRALEGATPSFDPIQSVSRRQDVGRHGNGARQAMAWRPVIG